jgi:hypothetical protein
MIGMGVHLQHLTNFNAALLRIEKGLVRDPAPLQPLEPFFAKTWRPSEVELVR